MRVNKLLAAASLVTFCFAAGAAQQQAAPQRQAPRQAPQQAAQDDWGDSDVPF